MNWIEMWDYSQPKNKKPSDLEFDGLSGIITYEIKETP